RERMLRAGKPPGNRQPPLGGLVAGGGSNRRDERGYKRERRRLDFFQRPMRIPFLEQHQRRNVSPVGPAEYVEAKLVLARASHELPAATLDVAGPESGGEAVVIGLGNWVELMVVAAGTFDRQPQERRARHMHQ